MKCSAIIKVIINISNIIFIDYVIPTPRLNMPSCIKLNFIMRDPFQLKMLHKVLENMKPDMSFHQRRGLICIMLLYVTVCGINELRNFNYPDLFLYC